jgi:hypothetical protein
VDNVRFTAATQLAVDSAASNFVSLCKTYRLTAKEEPPSTFLGMSCDYDAGTVRIKPALIARIMQAKLTPQPLDDLWALFSRCVYASRIMRLPLAEFFSAIKWMRRKCALFAKGTIKLDDTVAVWDVAAKDWRRWIHMIQENPPTAHWNAVACCPEFALYTDASTTGWGAVLFAEEDGLIREASGTWGCKKLASDMPVLETSAAGLAAQAFRDAIPSGAKLLLLVDSSSALGALRKGSSAVELMNKAVREALASFTKLSSLHVAHVTTDENPADNLSRGSLDRHQNLVGLGAMGRRLARSALPVRLPRQRVLGPRAG